MNRWSRLLRAMVLLIGIGLLAMQSSSVGTLVAATQAPKVEWQVIGTTVQEFEYDGLSRMTRSFDNNEPEDSKDDATVIYAYDSASRLLEEVQNSQAVSSRWMGDDNRVELVYPNGREIETTYDKLDRINTIKDKGAPKNIAGYDYIGPGRVLERTYANGLRLTYLDDARQKDVGYDGLERVVLHRHLRHDNSLVAGFAYDYDRANNKIFEVKPLDKDLKEDYTYDSIYRLGHFARQGEQEDTWQLDGANNWTKRKTVANQANNMNEYGAFASTPQLYDDNGNLIDDGINRYQYDYVNRLRKVIRTSDNAVIAFYLYDAHSRRNERVVKSTANANDQVKYFYDRWREIEEQRAGSTQQYVYGRWIDELLKLDKDTNNDSVIDQSFYYHQDAKTYVAALTDPAGTVVERVTYDAYGKPSSTASKIGNPYLFTGRRFDTETGLYYFRTRYQNPATGRFLQRDPLGIYGDEANLGNSYAFVANNPANLVDPSGMQEEAPYGPMPLPEGDCRGCKSPTSRGTSVERPVPIPPPSPPPPPPGAPSESNREKLAEKVKPAKKAGSCKPIWEKRQEELKNPPPVPAPVPEPVPAGGGSDAPPFSGIRGKITSGCGLWEKGAYGTVEEVKDGVVIRARRTWCDEEGNKHVEWGPEAPQVK
ncbi:RHS repeat-associated core domain-containing protein [Candidatus Acetothermia bacterium]|nr:RHS repeat-associated core domain-containing protein [Candidatus Acetothermia bacterium]